MQKGGYYFDKKDSFVIRGYKGNTLYFKPIFPSTEIKNELPHYIYHITDAITAKKDFVVCKVLTKMTIGGFMTPYREVPIKMNDTLKPDTDFPESLNINKDFCSEIEGSAIHVYIKPLPEIEKNKDYKEILFKAIVRKGTKFYINTDETEIAAEELYITDEEPTDEEIADMQEYIAQELIDAAEQHDGIRVGDILLSDKSYVHVEDYKNDGSMTAIGVVGYFIDRKPISVGLKFKKLQWASNEVEKDLPNPIEVSNIKAYKDYNGRRYTDNLYAAYKDRMDDFPALEFCVGYETEGTKKGDWYFPSSGEVANIARNLAVINYSLGKIIDTIDIRYCHWSSTEYSERNAWICHMNLAYLTCVYGKWNWGFVRPIIAL